MGFVEAANKYMGASPYELNESEDKKISPDVDDEPIKKDNLPKDFKELGEETVEDDDVKAVDEAEDLDEETVEEDAVEESEDIDEAKEDIDEETVEEDAVEESEDIDEAKEDVDESEDIDEAKEDIEEAKEDIEECDDKEKKFESRMVNVANNYIYE